MTVREELRIDGPRAMALAAVATAAENLGYGVRDIRKEKGLLVLFSGMTLAGASLGFIVTGRVRGIKDGSSVVLDATPVLGSWAVGSAQDELDEIVRETRDVLSAPRARIRTPELLKPGSRPFGFTPEILSGLWLLLAVPVFGLGFGGWLWIPAAATILGALLILGARPHPAWSWTVVACAVLSLPFGIAGAIARRLALTNTYWQGTADP